MQEHELKVREKDIEMLKAQFEANQQIARLALEAQSRSESAHAQAFHSLVRYRSACLITGIIGITAFKITALATEHGDVALEVAKALGFAAMGYNAGIGKAKWDASNKRNLSH